MIRIIAKTKSNRVIIVSLTNKPSYAYFFIINWKTKTYEQIKCFNIGVFYNNIIIYTEAIQIKCSYQITINLIIYHPNSVI